MFQNYEPVIGVRPTILYILRANFQVDCTVFVFSRIRIDVECIYRILKSINLTSTLDVIRLNKTGNCNW